MHSFRMASGGQSKGKRGGTAFLHLLFSVCIVPLPEFKCTTFDTLILRKIIKLWPSNVIHMYFKAKMHQIRFQLGLRQTPLGELTALPRPFSWIFKESTSK